MVTESLRGKKGARSSESKVGLLRVSDDENLRSGNFLGTVAIEE